MFNKRVEYVTVAPYKPFWEMFPKYKPKVIPHAKLNTDTIVNGTLSADDSMKMAEYRRTLVHAHKKATKPKRKKFLGIF